MRQEPPKLMIPKHIEFAVAKYFGATLIRPADMQRGSQP